MSDTVDNVIDAVEESEPTDVVVSEETEPVEEAPAEEVPVEEEPEPVVEEVPVEEEPEPVAEEVAEPAPSAPVSTQEVVQNVQEILSSTETNVSGNDLEERVKFLEERLEKLIIVLKESKCMWNYFSLNNEYDNLVAVGKATHTTHDTENIVVEGENM